MRTVGPILLILLVLSLLGGFAWLTRNPETPWLEEAEDWPLVGDLASRFRTAYLGPAARRDGETSQARTEPRDPPPSAPERPKRRPARAAPSATPKAPEEEAASTTRVTTTAPEGPFVVAETSSPEPADSVIVPAARITGRFTFETRAPRELQGLDGLPYKIREWTWCLPGNRILTAPEAGAGEQALLSSMSYLPVLGRQEKWAQVMYRGQKGWIDTAWEPPHRRRKAGRGILRHRHEPVRASDSRRLNRARKILGMDRPSRTLGAYTLYTDVEDEELLGFLYLAAGTAEDAYFARYGRLPAGNPKRSAVLFAKREDYRRFTQGKGPLSGNESGHAGSGVLAFFAEGRSAKTLARTLVHEIGHLLNTRALARGLPSWLSEGIASDLGALWVEGTPDESNLHAEAFSFLRNGSDLGLLQLTSTQKIGKLPSVGVLMSLDSKTFYSSPAYSYTHATGFLRYLLDSEDAGRGEPFRAFLGKIAAGFHPTPALLLKQLDTDVDDLDRRFRAWLEVETEAARERLGMPRNVR